MPTEDPPGPRLMPVVATVPLSLVALWLAWTGIRGWVLPHLGDDVADLLLITTGLASSPAVWFVVRRLRVRRMKRHARGTAVTVFVEDRGARARAYIRARRAQRRRYATRR